MPLVLAIPRGRLEGPAKRLLADRGISIPDKTGNSLISRSNFPGLSIATVRSFDVATFVAFGGADLGIVGKDVLEEFSYQELYELKDLQIGSCRLCLAATADADPITGGGAIRVATKYPNLTTEWFAGKNIQAQCIKLNGAVEIAPELGLCSYIIDLVDSGKTLKAHKLLEKATIMPVSAHLIANRTAWKTKNEEMKAVEERLKNGA